jgi:predicted nucleotidyltransferase component of viral defense system
MPLYREEADFDDLLAAAGEQLGLRTGVVEKDYWLTQALRGMQRAFPYAFVFKGGTSLSKAYGLIERFSEDVDILLLEEGLSKSGREKRMKTICEAAADEIGARSEKLGGGKSYRAVELFLDERPQAGPPALPFIRLDVGFSGGIKPHGTRVINTMIGGLLEERGQAVQTDYDDLQPLEVYVLAPWRTLVEKVILVNSVAGDCADKIDEDIIRRGCRHFYDIYKLLGDDDVRSALENRDEFSAIVDDALRITADHFNVEVRRPEGGFSSGLAFTCDGELRDVFEAEYQVIMDDFYFGDSPYPSFAETIERVHDHADLL